MGGYMNMVVVCEFSEGEELIPIILAFGDENLEVLFEFLINTFSLPIYLWVVGSKCSNLDPKQLAKFMHEFHNELGTSVKEDGLWESMELPEVVKVEVSSIKGGDGGVSGDEV